MPTGNEETASAVVGEALTPDEAAVLDFVVGFLARETYQPSLREICLGCGHKSTRTVSELIARLEEKGYMEAPGSRARGIRLIGVEITVTRRLTPPAGRARTRRPRE